ncbi:MAG: hypothetical protein KJ886_05275, partial [Candidatus Thermoplasmatota archaeon]|nr:hypothetical protein [Candidatus Thermoplasmatota archaeon]
MKTYLKVMFPSRARGNIQKVIDTLNVLGFKPVTGEHDFEYSWMKEPKIDEIKKQFTEIEIGQSEYEKKLRDK